LGKEFLFLLNAFGVIKNTLLAIAVKFAIDD